MLKERILLILVAILGGIFFSIGLFYFYQKTKVIPPPPSPTQETPSPESEQPSFFLKIDSPQDEEVFDKKIVPLTGKTSPQAKVIVSLEDKEVVLTPSPDGDFSLNLTLSEEVNRIEIVALSPDGKILKEKRSLTYTTESL